MLDFVKRTAVNTYDSSRRLQELGKNYQPKAVYPNTPLASKLRFPLASVVKMASAQNGMI